MIEISVKDMARGIRAGSQKALDAGTGAQRDLSRHFRDAVIRNTCRYGESPCRAHSNRLRTPLLLALLSIFLNPLLVLHVAGMFSHAARFTVAESLCGLNLLSGSLALSGYLIGLRYHSKKTVVKVGRNLALFHGIALLIMAWPIIEAMSYRVVPWVIGLVQNPMAYLTFVLIFSILAAVILPIPVETVLVGFIYYLVKPGTDFLGLGIAGAFILIAVIMGIGKAIGAWVVFLIGMKAEGLMNRYMSWGWFQRFLRKVERFCVKYGYTAMFIVMATPMMTDTVPLYVFSVLNKDGEVFDRNWFVMTNLWAGIARTLLVGILAVAGVMSFGYASG